MTVVVMAACTIYGWWVGRDRSRAYFALMLFLTGAIVGVFTAQDLLLFYAFFEAMLIPLYILIGVWGGPNRMRATITFVVYTVAGSLLMLAAVIVLGLQQGTFDLTTMGTSTSTWLFLGFVVAFLIKSPLFPFHGWLPITYRESPPEVAAILSGIVGKAGLYGLLRIAIPKFPTVAHDWRYVLLVLASISLVYGSLLAFRAPDFRGVVMYSSLSQSGLIVLGLFAFNNLGFDGAVLQIVNHALISASLFLLAGMVERRTSTGEFSRLGGMARGRPALATVVMTTGVIALAVPLSTSFAGEFLILAGVFQQGWVWAVIGATGIVLAAMYMLRAISGILHQEPGPAVSDAALDLRLGELAVVVPLVVCLLGLSAWPNLISGHASRGNQSATRRSWRGSASDRQAARRLVRDLAVPVAARGGGSAADGGGLRPGRTPPRRLRVHRFRRVRDRIRLRSARRRAEPGGDDDHRRLPLSRPLGGARAGLDRRRRAALRC